MYVQEIIIDGFKSYAKRTVIEGFDPMFNAITGLNGSGKSNILDSICFVLGISRLEQVRAGSLQELIYKQGQAGVQKATVTVVFNNKDKKASPVGYEAYDEITVCRQVAIGGRNKYLINGHVAQQNKVQNLFHSVQLNIHNPHFLIMQGRITKVINMGPMEVLGLIAEAAGTKMYESKKEAAMKTIEKKQAKVEEINSILSEDISPSLEKLRKERNEYMAWMQSNSDVEMHERFCTAYTFFQALQMTEKSQETIAAMREEENQIQASCDLVEGEIAQCKERVKAIGREKEGAMGDMLRELEAASTELSKALVKDTSAWQHKKEGYEEDKKALAKMRKDVAAMEKTMAAKKTKVDTATETVSKIQADIASTQHSISELERQRTALLAGCDAECKEGDKTLADQLSDARSRAAECDTEMKQLQRKVEHFKAELGEKRKHAKTAGKEFEALDQEHKRAQAAVAKVQKEVESCSYDESRDLQVRGEMGKAQGAVDRLREEVDALSGQVANLEVQFDQRAVDASKVHGIVASLVKLKDAKNALALEVACGARLYQLVVKDEGTGKELLTKGGLKKRVTIIPLNKIDKSTIPADKIKAAKEAVGDRATLALSLVGYDKEIEAAINYVFGKTMVCNDTDAAKTCALNDPKIRAKSVTLDGDLFDPAGTLTGGARGPPGSSILVKFAALVEKREELKAKEGELAVLAKEAATLKREGDAHRQAANRMGMCKHELSLVASRLEANPFFKASEELRVMEETVGSSADEMARIKKEKGEAEKEIKRLEGLIKKMETSRDSVMASKEKEIAAARKKLNDLQGKLKATREENEAILLQGEADAAELASLIEQADAAEAALETVLAEVQAAEASVAERKEAYDAAEGAVKSKRDELKRKDAELKQMDKDMDKLQDKLEKERVKAKKKDHEIQRFEKESKDASKAVDSMMREHGWISTEKHQFGKPGPYDFSKTKVEEVQKKLDEVKRKQDKEGKKINKKVMGMFEKAELEYQEVMNKKRIIENDKAKIEKVIEELDDKKNQALKTTWAKVNRDFSSIFSTLLPNAKAKLEPPEGATVLDGLVLRVGFGDCWKDSLSELSGGQRSLLALSLILSLLLFKPAPMYILDEIDAALDLSHTQNIGSMLKAHFKKSQFIIVSLKEGMFNNANVLFRTKFVDGVSTVMRTTPGGR